MDQTSLHADSVFVGTEIDSVLIQTPIRVRRDRKVIGQQVYRLSGAS